MNLPNRQDQFSEAIKQLTLLGYEKGEKIFFRAIDQNNKAIKSAAIFPEIPKVLKKQNQEKYSIYLVVNGGGDTDGEVIEGKAIFYEHDDRPKEEQLYLWQSLSLPEPTFQIDTGGKSIHSYWVFETPINVELWRSLQCDFLRFSDGDKSIKNPSRVMRLAGFVHPKTGEAAQIVNSSGKKYSYEELRAIVPKPEQKIKPTAPPPNKPKPHTGVGDLPPIPIERCLSRDNRSNLDGVGEGNRDNAAIAIARDLIGVAEVVPKLEFDYGRQNYHVDVDGDPYQVFVDFCGRCNPPLTTRDIDRIWNSAQSYPPAPAIADLESLKNCLRGWVKENNQHYQQNFKTSSGSRVDNVDNQSTDYQHLSTLINKGVREIFDRHLSAAERESQLTALARILGVNKSALDKIYQELESAQNNGVDNVDIDNLLNAKRRTLSPHDVLPKSIAEKIEQISRARGTNPEGMILGYLTSASAVVANQTRLLVRNYGDIFAVYPNLSGMVVGESGSLKTPDMKSSFVSPLRSLQDSYNKEYEKRVKEYLVQLREWENKPKTERDEEPETPRQKIVMIKDATIEKIEDIAFHQSEFSGAIYRDELIGLFQSFDKYGGKGSNDSRSKLLSYYDGDRIDKHRMGSGSQISSHDYHPAIFGGIQPEVLKDLAKSIGMDSDGTLCRFLYAPTFRTFKEWDTDPDRELINVDVFSTSIQNIHKLPAREFTLDRDGQRAWAKVADYYNRELCENHSLSPWVRHTYSKAVGQLGKIALTLYLIENSDDGDSISRTISAATIARAAIALDYFINQAIALIASTEETLAAHLVRVLEKARKLGTITPRQVQQSFSGKKRIDGAIAKTYLTQLAQGGYGSIDSKGIFTPYPETSPQSRVDNVDKMLITYQQPETSKNNGSNDFVDKLIKNPSPSQQEEKEDGVNTTTDCKPSRPAPPLDNTDVSISDNRLQKKNGYPEVINIINTEAQTQNQSLVDGVDKPSTDNQQLSTNLKEGDRVRYVGGFNRLKGKSGKITKLAGRYVYTDFSKESIPFGELEAIA